jgi:CTP:molybdopterin cytidylyltransferase MocA
MSDTERSQHANIRVIVMAAQRKGIVNPLARRFGISHKCLIPMAGKPLIRHVVETVASHPDVCDVVISIEEASFGKVGNALSHVRARADVRFCDAADNLADSVTAAAAGHKGPLVVTTADHPLLTHQSIDAVRDGLRGSEAVIAMTRGDFVKAVNLDGQARYYRFRCGEYSNCNLYGLASAEHLRAAEIFRGGGQFVKKAGRIVSAFGILNLLLLRSRLISLQAGMKRISRRIGLRVLPVILEDGSQAIDVDNDNSYRIVSELLGRRDDPQAKSELTATARLERAAANSEKACVARRAPDATALS